MRLVIQRVKSAGVTVDGVEVARIDKGLLVFLGVGEGDTEEYAKRFADKLLKLRIFEDAEGKTNLSVRDVEGEILVVSQFTLYADCRKGNRPSFVRAAEPALAEKLYEYFKHKLQEQYGSVKCGEFGADMKVDLLNDGPFTILFDSADML